MFTRAWNQRKNKTGIYIYRTMESSSEDASGCSAWIVSLILATAATVLIFIYNEWNIRYYKSLGLPGPKPLPIIGNLHQIVKYGQFAAEKMWLKEFGDVYVWGLGKHMNVTVKDQDIIREVLVKDFPHFTNRRLIDTVPNPLDKGIFFLQNQHWKKTRSILTPTFSASKLRCMTGQINSCAHTLLKSLENQEGKTVEIKDFYGAFTMDVISSTAFGIKSDFLSNRNDPFLQHMAKIFDFKVRKTPPYFVLGCAIFGKWYEKLMKFLHICFFPKESMYFFIKEVKAMIEDRQQNPANVLDFLQLMLNATSEDDGNSSSDEIKRLTTDEIVGQAFLFFLAGYETTASLLSFCAYEMAIHPEVQEKLLQEIEEKLPDQEEPNYDNIGKLRYMENIIYETLRMYPPLPRMSRVASEEVEIKGITIPKDLAVTIPVYQIHHDPDIYENPFEFQPERYADFKPNQKQIDFLPFGFGPRICIGMRLALVEAKIALVHVVRRIKFVKSEKTEVPLKIKDIGFTQPLKPIKVQIQKRIKVDST